MAGYFPAYINKTILVIYASKNSFYFAFCLFYTGAVHFKLDTLDIPLDYKIENLFVYDDNTYFLYKNNYYYKTFDGGENWTLDSLDVIDSKFTMGPNGEIYVSGGKVFKSEDMGNTFKHLDLGELTDKARQVRFDEDNQIYIGTETEYYKLIDPSSAKLNSAISNLIFPNPASDFIEIMIDCNDKTYYADVVDLLGINISTTEINSKQNKINISNLPTGIYFVRIDGKLIKFIKE